MHAIKPGFWDITILDGEIDAVDIYDLATADVDNDGQARKTRGRRQVYRMLEFYKYSC